MTTLYSIRTIAEQSVLDWFTTNSAALPGVQIVKGQTADIRSVPIIILHAESAQAHRDFGAKPSGNFEITFKIYIYSSADDNTLDEHRARVEAVQGIMQHDDGLKTAWTQGQLYATWIMSDDEGVADRRYGNALTYTLVCVYPPEAV
jgi:hypothetical protein